MDNSYLRLLLVVAIVIALGIIFHWFLLPVMREKATLARQQQQNERQQLLLEEAKRSHLTVKRRLQQATSPS